MLIKEQFFGSAIHRKEKDGDWYIYLECFAHENSKRAYKNPQKNCKSLKLDKSNAISVGTTAVKPYLCICLMDLVWFARYCGKMYSRHLFSLRWIELDFPLFYYPGCCIDYRLERHLTCFVKGWFVIVFSLDTV